MKVISKFFYLLNLNSRWRKQEYQMIMIVCMYERPFVDMPYARTLAFFQFDKQMVQFSALSLFVIHIVSLIIFHFPLCLLASYRQQHQPLL